MSVIFCYFSGNPEHVYTQATPSLAAVVGCHWHVPGDEMVLAAPEYPGNLVVSRYKNVRLLQAYLPGAKY